MTTRSRCRLRLVAAAWIWANGSAFGQDTPLYRDPGPTEGPRVGGPLLSPFPPLPEAAPPPPGVLGPFQPQNHGLPDVAPEIPRDPLLTVPPIAPPLPAPPLPPIAVDGDVKIRRKTTIRGPKGVLGRCHEWFHDTFFTARKTPTGSTARHGLTGWFSHANFPEDDDSHSIFKRPSWPSWPLRDTP
jgi:hypothetical protein